jgi:hypothetical protein
MAKMSYPPPHCSWLLYLKFYAVNRLGFSAHRLCALLFLQFTRTEEKVFLFTVRFLKRIRWRIFVASVNLFSGVDSCCLRRAFSPWLIVQFWRFSVELSMVREKHGWWQQ